MTDRFVDILEESRRAVVYMQLPIVGFLAIASFQVRRAQDKAAFALAGYGWILNIAYIAFNSGMSFIHWPARFGLADPVPTEMLASFFDAGTDGLFILAYLAADGSRLLPPKWFRFDVITLLSVMIVSWSGSVLAVSIGNRFPVRFIALSLPFVTLSLVSRVLLGKALFEQTKTEVPVDRGPKHLYWACLFYASFQPLYLLMHIWHGSQTLGFILGFVAKATIALGFVKLFSGLASKFASEQGMLDMARRILGRIRHELNTPLGEMKNWTDAAMTETSHAKIKHYLLQMESATQRALAITSVQDDALFQAIVTQEPLGDGVGSKAKELVNINTLVQTAILAVKTTRSEEVRWQVSFAAGNCIYGSREQVIQILVNVLRNAYDAMPESQGRITVATTQVNKGEKNEERRFVRVSIKDDGEGFSQSIQESAFNDGFSTREGPNRGHGLFIVRQLLAANEGSLEVVSPCRSSDKKRPGTEVTILFPRMRCDDGSNSQGANRG